MKCQCGCEVTTKFCPECGTPSESFHNIQGLLRHVQMSLHSVETRVTMAEKHLEGKQQTPASESRMRKIRNTAKKWKAWEEALLELIAIAAEAQKEQGGEPCS